MDLFSLISLFFLLTTLLLSTLNYLLSLSSTTLTLTPSYGFLPFFLNRRRLLHWYTHLLSLSPSLTVVIHRLAARRTVITANPDNVEHILKTNFHNYPKGKPFTDILGDLLGHGIFNSDGDLWLSQRKLASHEFTSRSLRDLVYVAIDSEANHRLLPFLSLACDSRRVFDLQELLRLFAFDVICKISLGVDPSQLPSSFSAAFDAASAVSASRGSAPVPAIWKLKRALRIGSELRLHNAVTLINETVMNIISERKLQVKNSNNVDLLSKLIAGGSSDEEVRDMVISFIMAGRDTTSSALTWFFWLITRSPKIEAELVKEISRIVSDEDNNGKQAQGITIMSYDKLKELVFLEACLYESMRLYPPVVWDSKHAESDDVLPDGTRVKGGDRVTYMAYAMGRMGRIWGEDWGEFRPGRWLGEEGMARRMRKDVYKYPVFQGGPRVCLGKEMAFVQMKYVAAAVLAGFEMRTVVDDDDDKRVVPMLTAHMEGGLKVVVVERRPERGSRLID